MGPAKGGLPFLSLVIGEVFVLLASENYHNATVPETQLLPAVIGGTVFSLGVYWLGWTGYKESIHWVAPTASGVFIGFGIITIFLQFINYLVDSYLSKPLRYLQPIRFFDLVLLPAFLCSQDNCLPAWGYNGLELSWEQSHC
ncbi:hypothetical protein N7540_006260 [Penicillium herquei]|nr:hypothetical protein N7540_006260 [Penicillium herquei]